MEHREILRRLAIGDTSFLEDMDGNESGNLAVSGLDAKTNAFACLGAAVALDANPSGYQTHVDDAFAAGATTAEIVGVLVAVGPTVGLTRMVSAAPALGLAVGYDCDAALEQRDPTQ